MKDYFQIGKIINTHGLKGHVKVMPLTDDNKRYEKLKKIHLEGTDKELEIEKVWYNKGFVMLKFKGYDNIDDVISFKDKFILIHKSDAVQLPEDSYFIHDIIGLEVYTVNDIKLGKITNVLQPGANDVYVVKNEKKEYLIPAVKDIVKKIDLSEKKIIIDPIEGMIE